MDERISILIKKLQEINPHILIAVQHFEEKLVCTAFLSEVLQDGTLVLHEKSFDEKLVEEHEEEALLAFLNETTFLALTN